MTTSVEIPQYEKVLSKKLKPEEEKYQNYLFDSLNAKTTNTLQNTCPYKPQPYPNSKVYVGNTITKYPNAGYNSTVNYYNFSNAFTGFNRLPKQTDLEFGVPIEDENNPVDEKLDFPKFKTEETFNLNTLQEFEKNLEKLKKDNENYKKLKKNKKNPHKYITQEEIKQKKELIFGSVEDLKNYLKKKKNLGNNWFKRFVKLSEEKGIHLCDLIEAKTPEELEIQIKQILQKE